MKRATRPAEFSRRMKQQRISLKLSDQTWCCRHASLRVQMRHAQPRPARLEQASLAPLANALFNTQGLADLSGHVRSPHHRKHTGHEGARCGCRGVDAGLRRLGDSTGLGGVAPAARMTWARASSCNFTLQSMGVQSSVPSPRVSDVRDCMCKTVACKVQGFSVS